MSKRSLMLSTAAVAVLTGAAFADTTISSSKSEAYTTGALLSSNSGQANAGNITIASGGSVGIKAAQGALVVDTNNWILQQASVTNKDNNSAYGIHVALSADRDLSGASFKNTAGTTITGTGIYLDSSSNTSVYGSGTGKIGLYVDNSGCAAGTTCTYTGNINVGSGATLAVTGDSSTAIQIGSSSTSAGTGVLKGDLIIGGSVTATASSTSASATNMYGVRVLQTITGNINLQSGGAVAAYGAGSHAMSIEGNGVSGSLQIAGSLATSPVNVTNYNINQKVNTTTNPEAGAALQIATGIAGGVYIAGPTSSTSASAGTIKMVGAGPAVVISPTLNSVVTTPTTPMTIGVYTADGANPGFSFYNRGAIQATISNYNKGTTGMVIAGYSTALPTILTGGIYNSGSLQANATTSGTGISTSNLSVTGLYISDYAKILEGSGKNPAASGDLGDQAALVNSGAVSSSTGLISASIDGDRGGVATAVYVTQKGSLPSIINSGTISATVTTTDATLKGNASGSANPVVATAILDASGTLTKITNSGTISAQAGYISGSTISPLDNNSQIANAIDLRGGDDTTPSGDGVTITNQSTAARAATITGNILFGTGDKQKLILLGTGSNMSTVNGNVIYGLSKSGTSSGDVLDIGRFSSLTGAVLTRETASGAGVTVNVRSGGTLTLLNDSTTLNPLGIDCALTPQACTLNAKDLTVESGGTLSLGVNRSLSSTGGDVAASGTINLAAGSHLGVAYASYLPQGADQFVVMTAPRGQLYIDQATLNEYNNPTNRPYLLKSATLCSTQLSVSCTRPSGLAGTRDALIIEVAPKSIDELGLTPGSVAVRPITTSTGKATTLFEQANIALGADDTLGAAFINGIHNASEAQKAYNDMAPNITGGTRAIAISITDSASGPVGARQRALRMYSKTPGDTTLWGTEFAQMLKDPGSGALDPNTGYKTNPGFKDHGFGFAVGLDGGSPKYGWYGGAFTFYTGDVNELSRTAHENQQWYLLSFYSTWRGKGLFLDTKLDAGYGNITGKRTLTLLMNNLTSYTREADNKHSGALLSGSVATGVSYAYGAFTMMPQLNLDGLLLREEGYTEHNPGTTTVGDGFDLKVNPYYAKSLRLFAGLDVRYDLEVWDLYLQPELRGGYRYDFLTDPAKVKAAFAYADTSSVIAGPGSTFTLTGPDPSKGNFVVGGSLAVTTNTWTLGANFDLVRGNGGAFQQVGTLSLVGRI